MYALDAAASDCAGRNQMYWRVYSLQPARAELECTGECTHWMLLQATVQAEIKCTGECTHWSRWTENVQANVRIGGSCERLRKQTSHVMYRRKYVLEPAHAKVECTGECTHRSLRRMSYMRLVIVVAPSFLLFHARSRIV